MSFDKSVSSYLRQMDLPGDLQKAISLSEAFAHGFEFRNHAVRLCNRQRQTPNRADRDTDHSD